MAQIASFVAVGDELNFGRAAERVGCSQPALSQKIKRLEEYVGFDLVDRSQRQVKLTAAGSVFLVSAKRILADTTEMIASAAKVAQGRAGVVRVGYVEAALIELVPELRRELGASLPDVDLTLIAQSSEEQFVSLASGALDVGLVKGSGNPSSGVIVEPVLTESFEIAMSSDHPLAGRDAVALKDLADHPFVMCPREREPEMVDLLMNGCIQAGFSPQVVQTASEVQSLLALAASNIGLSFVTESIAKNMTREGVVFRPLSDSSMGLTLSMAYPAGEPCALVTVVIDTLRALSKRDVV